MQNYNVLENSQDASTRREFALNVENLLLSTAKTLNASSMDAKNILMKDATNANLLSKKLEISAKLLSVKKSGMENANYANQDISVLMEDVLEEILSALSTTKKDNASNVSMVLLFSKEFASRKTSTV